jgi:FkbM family methyltransferase
MDSVASFDALTKTALRIKVVDVGASPLHGDPVYQPLVKRGEADVVGFEPNPRELAAANEKKGPHETYLPYAVGDGRARVLNFCRSPGMTSLFEPNPHVLGLFHGFSGWAEVVNRAPLETHRLDDIAETSGADMLALDIQGGELLALRNAPHRLREALVIQSEVEFLPMYVDQPLFSDVELYLRQSGFVFHRFYPLRSRIIQPMLVNDAVFGGMSQTLYADAVFVKDFTRPADFTLDQLIKTAKILHDCYESFDLSYHLLREVDSRAGGQLAADYLAGLRAAIPSISVVSGHDHVYRRAE